MTNAAIRITYAAYLQAIQDGAMGEARILEKELEVLANDQGLPNPILNWKVG